MITWLLLEIENFCSLLLSLEKKLILLDGLFVSLYSNSHCSFLFLMRKAHKRI